MTTQPGSPASLMSGAASPDPIGALNRIVQDMQRDIRELKSAKTLNASTVNGNLTVGNGGDLRVTDGGDLIVDDDGNLVVQNGGVIEALDGAGNAAVTLGALADGTFGLSIRDPASGNQLGLSRLAFGLAANSSATAVEAGTKGTFTPDGLTVSVTISTGRMLVLCGATITMATPTGTDLAHGYYGYSLAGAQSLAASVNRAVRTDFGAFAFQGMTATLLTGLAAGTYTVQGAVMRTTDGTDAPPTVSASVRSLTVFPF